MGNIITAKRVLDDNLDTARVAVSLAGRDAALDTVAKRLVVTTDFSFSSSEGGSITKSKTRMLSEHPGLTAGDRTILRQLVAKIYNFEVDNDPLA